MTDIQLYLTIGLPVFAILVSMTVNVVQFAAVNARITALESVLHARIAALDASVNARFDTLIGKIIEIDNRLTRVEERLEHR